jgi:hypothetical protein
MWFLKYIIVVPFFLVGCGGVRYQSSTASGSSSSDKPEKKNSFLERLKNFGYDDTSPLRDNAVKLATKHLNDPAQKDDFGSSDLADILSRLNIHVAWSENKPFSILIRAAEVSDAYDTSAIPMRGDIVLFHNQFDRNKNRIADDWLTGCGIVIKIDGTTFSALVRTGRGPRLVRVTPDAPSVRERNGAVINSFLRVPTGADPKDADYLAGLLYAGKIDLEKLTDR